MSDYQERIKDFEYYYTSVIDESVIALSATFDRLYEERNSEHILDTINKVAQPLTSKDYNVPTKMQIFYDIANAYHDLRRIDGENEQYIEKEVFFFRSVLDLFESNFDACEQMSDDENIECDVAKYIAMRSYTNLGNTFKAIGRYIAAIDCYQNALLISDDFAMASLNLSFSLFNYAQLQIKPYEMNYYHHAFYHYYSHTKRCRCNLEKKEYFENLHNCVTLLDEKYIEEYLSRPLSLPEFSVDNDEESLYRNYLLVFRLFLDPCLDILSEPCFAVDSINLPFSLPLDEKEKEFTGLFNQIKQEYNWARYLWYKASTDNSGNHFADNELDLLDIGDEADYSIRESILRNAFKAAYSLFDRIGYFINAYFNVGLVGTKISFKNVWKTQLCDEKGNVLFSIPNPIGESYPDNPLIKAMLWLQKDFFESKKVTVTAPHAERIFQMRNDMEHNCLRTGKKAFDVAFTKYTFYERIEDNTFRLLKMAREMIIYLCLAVNYEITKCTKDGEEKA